MDNQKWDNDDDYEEFLNRDCKTRISTKIVINVCYFCHILFSSIIRVLHKIATPFEFGK